MSHPPRRRQSSLAQLGLCAEPDAPARFAPAGLPWAPNADVVTLDHEIVVRLEIPGADTSELLVVQQGRQLVIQGVRPRPDDGEGARHEMMEIQYGPFARVFEFPGYVRLEDIQASYEAGFLVIRLARCMKAPRASLTVRVTVAGR
jgi:HSP20 family protein